MPERRYKNWNWHVATADGKFYENVSDAQILAVLMDIRDELQRMNAVLHCGNFLDIPHKLERIKRNTAKPRKPKAKKPALRVVNS